MSVALAEPVVDRPVPHLRAVPSPAPTRSRPRRPGPGVGPSARPRRLRFVAPPAGPARACSPAPALVAPTPTRRRTWRLTDRGVAVVLVVAAALVAASVAVVGLTALRVTSEGYHRSPSVSAPLVVEP